MAYKVAVVTLVGGRCRIHDGSGQRSQSIRAGVVAGIAQPTALTDYASDPVPDCDLDARAIPGWPKPAIGRCQRRVSLGTRVAMGLLQTPAFAIVGGRGVLRRVRRHRALSA